MKPYIKGYMQHFGIHPGEPIYDEYEYIVNNRMVIAQNIHHVLFGANKFEGIENWMALSYNNHTKAHNELLNRYDLRDIHLEFLNNNPYL